VQNNENKWFLWSVLSALHPVTKDAQRVSKCPKYENEFDEALKDIEFPVKLTDMSKFAKRTNISINVYAFDSEHVVPLQITKEKIHMLFYFITKTTTVGFVIFQDYSDQNIPKIK
jgi:hypothetical protein